MAKKFGGFTEQQKEVLARSMGFQGPMDQFGKFLQSSPAHSQKYTSYVDKAKNLVEGSPVTPNPEPSFADGGLVGQALKGVNELNKSTSSSAGNKLTSQVLAGTSNITPTVSTTLITPSSNEMISQGSGQVVKSGDVQAVDVSPTTTATAPVETAAPVVTTDTSAQKVEDATSKVSAVQGTVSQNAQVEAATALPSANATVQGQMASLMKQFEGGEVPAWAAGAVRNANAVMAQRGLGSSSMAGAAVTQAAMESAIQIAAQDAATFSSFEMQNLNNRQQARLVNAQSFLQMDLANLNAAQQTNILKSQSIVQSLFTDQAAENATRQFNASSESQTEQFFASLKTQVQQFNAAQVNGMEQFKAGQKDSVAMFNRQMSDATDQFNAKNRLIIDQSNAEWRRAVTTANNATINEANRTNAMNRTSMTMAAYNNLMQKERDMYSFAFTAAENAAGRANELVLARYQQSGGNGSVAGEALGKLAGSLLQNIFSGE